jgi:hypothetical protein
MIKFIPPQDLFEYDADYYVNTVNTVGVPGAGVALQFAEKRPQETAIYKKFCKNPAEYGIESISGGDIFVYNNIIFAFTKEHYKDPSQYDWIEKLCNSLFVGFEDMEDTFTVISPPVGCGFGGLSWVKVKKIISKSKLVKSKHLFVFIEKN